MKAIHHLDGNIHNNDISNLMVVDADDNNKKIMNMKKRPRDSQLRKFWLAWGSIDRGEVLDVKDAEAFASKIVRSRWWKNRTDVEVKGVTIRFFNATTKIGEFDWNWNDDMARLRLPASDGGIDDLTKMRILVTMCHHLQPLDSAYHGPEYGKLLLDAVKRFVGETEHLRLKKALQSNRFKLRSVSPEARAEASARWKLKQMTKTLQDDEGPED